MSHLKVQLRRAGMDDVATFEIGGSDLFLNALIPELAEFVRKLVITFGVDEENRIATGYELGNALEALMNGLSYYGKIVTVTRMEEPVAAARVNGSEVSSSSAPHDEGERL